MKFIKRSILLMTLLCIFSSAVYPMEIAITVDDMAAHGELPPHVTRVDIVKQMLLVFKKHHITGVYGLMNGDLIAMDKDDLTALKIWVSNGQLLGNHTFSHLDLAKVTADNYIQDIQKNEPILLQLMGSKNYRYFRYPFLSEGNTQEKRDRVRDFLFENHYQIAPVTVDFFDYEWNDPYARCMKKQNKRAISWLKKSFIEQSLYALTIAHALSEMLFQRDIKNVMLIHIGAFDALMLDKVLTKYEKQGVTFISLPQALTDDVYKINPDVVRDRAYTFLNQIRISQKLSNPDIVTQLYETLPEEKLNQICR